MAERANFGAVRLMVALLFDPATAELLDALRAEVGETRPERIPPHVTLVAPFDAAADEVDAAAAAVSRVATGTPVLPMVLGPGATFAPRTPTVHLEVAAATDEATAALHRLPTTLHAAGLGRAERRPYVPHVTLKNRVRGERLRETVEQLAGFEHRCRVDTVGLLGRSPAPGAVWDVLASSTLAGG